MGGRGAELGPLDGGPLVRPLALIIGKAVAMRRPNQSRLAIFRADPPTDSHYRQSLVVSLAT